MADVILPIVGARDKQHQSLGDVPFNHLEPFHEDLTAPMPDTYYGAAPEQIDPQVRHGLGKHMIPSNITSRPVAPNYFLEVKRADGNGDVARRQACYDNIVGARVMHSLQNYGSVTPKYDGNAYSIASTYVDGQLKMFATHPAAPTRPGQRSQYVMTQLDSYALAGNINTFRQGAGAYRNGRDWAQAQRDRFITSANEVARSKSDELTSTRTPANGPGSLSTAAERDFAESDSSADELALHWDKASKGPGSRFS